jgi:isopentenyl-diphosphate delta-isomerase type 1
MATNWNGNASQAALMQTDEVILVDFDDKVIGHGSKAHSHEFTSENPRGLLHRAFSVFLFDTTGRLLLQQRAADKITFPNVWTNTCCSHPLYPTEVDDDAALNDGSVMAVKSAAIRKLYQELGIEAKDLPIKKFKYLTRLHYWAADVVTHGKMSPWGEQEIDYILFIQVDVKCKPNLEEVMDFKYVTEKELKAMMEPSTGLLWSPWFRIIAGTFLSKWWADLNTTLTTDNFVDTKTIFRFDPTEEHMGGKGSAGKWLGKVAAYMPEASGAASGNKVHMLLG